MGKSALIIDSMHESILEMLKDDGIQVNYHPDAQRNDLPGLLSGNQILVVRSKTQIDSEVMDWGTELEIIARSGSGVDNIDDTEAHRRNIKVLNAPEGNRAAVGDHTLGLILNLINNITSADKEVRNGKWDREGNRGYELSYMTVGIIGYGNTGSEVGKRLSAFGCKVLAYDKYKIGYYDGFCKESNMEELFQESDILTLHIPLTDETENMVDNDFIQSFRKNIFLINAARGPIVKMKTIVDNLNSGKLLGAGLDVLENEKINQLSDEQQIYFNELCKSQKVIFTPHVGGWTFESYEKLSTVLAEKIILTLNEL